MTAITAPIAANAFGSSRWARYAGFLLIGLGIGVSAFGVLIIGQGVLYDDVYNMGYGVLGIAIGVFILVAGLLHVLAGTYVLRHRTWARVLGVAIALVGVWFAWSVLPTAFNQVITHTADYQPITVGPNPTSMAIGLSIVPYMVIIGGLIVGGRQFRRNS